ncbi:AAA-domain-containing protein [Atractiella rhizophila]|nr:AAA-domain-containing protein [Atractiella rhizophila]
MEVVGLPVLHPEVFRHLGIRAGRGILLHGPSGTGKTMLANALAGELDVPFISISSPSLVSGMSGESEKAIRDTFEEAMNSAPCVLFIDEIDAITGKRENAQREMERRIVAQLLTCFDDLTFEKTNGQAVIVMGATNRPDSIDPALRRSGRFDTEIGMGVPDERARQEILRVLCSNLRLTGDFDFKALAKMTPGYVGTDLRSLTEAAGITAVKRIFNELATEEQLQQRMEIQNTMDSTMIIDDVAPPAETTPTKSAPFSTIPQSLLNTPISRFLRNHPLKLSQEQLAPLSLTPSDFQQALPLIQPSALREGFTTVPDVTWADIGALHSTREELRMSIVEPIRRREVFERLGIEGASGVLLWGPPGSGKTLVAKAVANESGANFISVKGPELLNKYVGESERAVRQVFARARASNPCIIFFDELDALVPRRDDSLSESSARVVNTLLTELDGLSPRGSVYVIAATNRPDMIDPAMARPGRLDKLLYVDFPTPSERADILLAQTKRGQGTPLAADVDLVAIAHDERCDGFTGADLSALVREAAVSSLREVLGVNCGTPMLMDVDVKARHFEAALNKVAPSVNKKQRKKYEDLRVKMHGRRAVEVDPQENVE